MPSLRGRYRGLTAVDVWLSAGCCYPVCPGLPPAPCVEIELDGVTLTLHGPRYLQGGRGEGQAKAEGRLGIQSE